MQQHVKPGTPWYETGLAFDCTKCGKCCRVSEDRLVNVNDNEIREIASLLRTAVDDVYSKHTTLVEDDTAIRGKKKKLVLRARTNNNGEKVCSFILGHVLQY